MYSINDKVVYGSTGLCIVSELKEISFEDEQKQYYILTPVEGKGTVYVPVEGSEAKLRNLITKEKADELIDGIKDGKISWIENDMLRKSVFAKIIKDADPQELLQLLKNLYISGEIKKAQHKKIHINDEKTRAQAEKILFNEIGEVKNLLPDEVREIIYEKIKQCM